MSTTYKVVDADQLNSDLADIAEAIRTKGGTSALLSFPEGMIEAIEALASGGDEVRAATISLDSETSSITLPVDGEPDWYVVLSKGSNTDISNGVFSSGSSELYNYVFAVEFLGGTTANVSYARVHKTKYGVNTSTHHVWSYAAATSIYSNNTITISIPEESGFPRFASVEYMLIYGNGNVSSGGIIPSGDIRIVQNNTTVDVAQYATATIDVPEESLADVIGGYTGSSNRAKINSAISAANVKTGGSDATLYAAIETLKSGYNPGGGSSSGGSIGSSGFNMKHTNNTPANYKGYYHYRTTYGYGFDTTKLIGFYAMSDVRVVGDTDGIKYLTGVFYNVSANKGWISYVTLNGTSGNSYSNTVAMNSSTLNGAVWVSADSFSDGTVEIYTDANQTQYLFANDSYWTLIPIYSS